MKAIFVAAFVTVVIGANAAKSDVVLTYTSNDFTAGTGPYTTSDSVTGSITLSGPLGDNLSDAAVTPLSFSFKDGVQTIDDTANSAGADRFNFWTNASGVITGWDVVVYNLSNTVFDDIVTDDNSIFVEDVGDIETCNPAGSSPGVCAIVTANEGSNDGAPGSWSVTTTTVPEPLTLSLFGAGLVGAAAMRRRKAK